MAANECDDRAQQERWITNQARHPPQPCRNPPRRFLCAGRQGFALGVGNDSHAWAPPNPPPAPQGPRTRIPVPVPDNWEVCYTCNENIFRQPFIRQFRGLQRSLPSEKETRRWKGYWTRLCYDCQVCEQLLICQRDPTSAAYIIGVPGLIPPPFPTQAQQDLMANFPFNTCTCSKLLQPTNAVPSRCFEHVHQHVEDIRRRCDRLKTLNKRWLESICRDPAGNLRTSSEGLRAQRMDDRTWRACRCGNEVLPLAQSRIFQCMACEGIRLADRDNPVALPVPVLPRHQLNSVTAPGQYTLRRPVSAVVHGISMAAVIIRNGIDI